jgi:hypothetical protein
MKQTRAELKAELLVQAEANIEEFLDWLEKSPMPTLTQIEDSVLQFRHRLGREMAETAIQAQDTATRVPGPKCPICGQEMESKSKKGKHITSRVGDLKLKRTYYYCPGCRKGLFPLDEQLRVWDRVCSEGIAKLAVWLCGHVTAEVAEQILNQVGGGVFRHEHLAAGREVGRKDQGARSRASGHRQCLTRTRQRRACTPQIIQRYGRLYGWHQNQRAERRVEGIESGLYLRY